MINQILYVFFLASTAAGFAGFLFFLYRPSDNQQRNALLCLFIALISCRHASGFPGPVQYLYGVLPALYPCFYFLIRTLVQPEFRFSREQYVHLAPLGILLGMVAMHIPFADRNDPFAFLFEVFAAQTVVFLQYFGYVGGAWVLLFRTGRGNGVRPARIITLLVTLLGIIAYVKSRLPQIEYGWTVVYVELGTGLILVVTTALILFRPNYEQPRMLEE